MSYMMSRDNKYMKIAVEIAGLVNEKNLAYGNSFGKSGAIINILYPEGFNTEQINDVLTITRIIDKLFRIATRKNAFGENPWRDCLGYCLLAVARDEEARNAS